MKFDSIEEALEALRNGDSIIVVMMKIVKMKVT